MYRFTTPAVLLACTVLQAQDIQFDPGHWTSSTIATQQEHALLYENRLLSDTMFVEDSSTLALEMVVASPTLARVEFDPTTRTRVRRINIRQVNTIDSMYVENARTGEMELVTRNVVMDVPNGLYEEFHTNGSLKRRGYLRLSGPGGTLTKTGHWSEWDKDGNVVQEETHP